MAKDNILGVDIGTGSIKALAGMTDESGRIAILGCGTVPAAGLNKGELAVPELVAQAVKEAVACAAMAADITPGRIYLGIGGMDIAGINNTGSIAISGLVAENSIEQACRAAIVTSITDDRYILHVLPTDYWVDGRKTYSPLGMGGRRLDVKAHIVTSGEPGIKKLLAALEAAGVPVAGIMANSVVGSQALLADSPRENSLVLDIGAGLADIALYRYGQICMSASVPLGGDYITGDIMQGVGVTRNKAEEIVRHYAKLNKKLLGQNVTLDYSDQGEADKRVSYDFLHKIVVSRVEEIVALLHTYLQPVLSGNPVDRVLLTGGCSMLPCFAENVDKLFGVSVNLIKPEELPAEYAHPSNIACYGLLRYITRLHPASRVEHKGWKSVFKKIKSFI